MKVYDKIEITVCVDNNVCIDKKFKVFSGEESEEFVCGIEDLIENYKLYKLKKGKNLKSRVKINR